MAQKIQVLLTDDIDGTEASETVRFSLDGIAYEIDLNDENSMKLRASFAPYVGNARREKSAGRSRRGATPSKREDTTAVRAWAKSSGRKVSDRGRIPAEVYEAYRAAHS